MAIPRHLAAWRRHTLVNSVIMGSGFAGILLAVACLLFLLPMERSAMRAQPLYWLLLVPAAAWSAALADFKKWAIRWFLRVTVAIAFTNVFVFVAIQTGVETSDTDHARALAVIAAVLAAASAAMSRRSEFRRFVAESNRPNEKS